MTRPVFWIAAPVLLWALHFAVVYALISAGCGPRALMAPEMLRVTVSLLTLVAVVAGLVLLIGAGRRQRRVAAQPDPAPDASLAAAAYWTAVIALLAMMMNVTPVAVLSSCAG